MYPLFFVSDAPNKAPMARDISWPPPGLSLAALTAAKALKMSGAPFPRAKNVTPCYIAIHKSRRTKIDLKTN